MIRFYPALIFNFSVAAPPPRRSPSPPSLLPSPSRQLLVLSRFSYRIYFDLLSSDGSSLQRSYSPISPPGYSSPYHLRTASPFVEVADFWAPLLFFLLFLLVFSIVVLLFVGLLSVDDCWRLGALLCR
jgi:hypothetical protein